MKVSVVIPLYNKEAYIQRAMDSVLAQTCEDWELIVVDDESTDGSVEVVRRYSDPRVRLIQQKNGGAATARNKGVCEARSDLVAFLDADDVWDADFLETALALQERFPQASVWSTARRDLLPDGCVVCPKYHGTLPAEAAGGLIDYFRKPAGDSPLHPSSVIIRKGALLACGGFPSGVVLCADHDTWLRLALRYPIAWTPLAKITYDTSPVGRESCATYLGNFPYFDSVRAFLREVGPGRQPPEGTYEFVARRCYSRLSVNWLAGERAVVREIVRDCCGISGYRFRCALWYLLSYVPRPAIRFGWKGWRLLRKRGQQLPQFLPLYPEKYRHLRCMLTGRWRV